MNTAPSPRRFFLLLTLTALLAITSCAILAPSSGKASPRAEERPPASAEAKTSVAPPRTEENLLQGLPPRVRGFLAELKTRSLAHDWDWVVSKAESAHYDRWVKRRGMDRRTYLSLLFRIGGSYAQGKNDLLTEPRGFDITRLTVLVFTRAEKDGFVWRIRGTAVDARGTSIDFTLEVLGDLQDILLSGD